MDPVEDRLMTQLVERLAEEFPYVPEHVVIEAVQNAHSRFEAARIREFVPLFVERCCRAEFARHPAIEISV